MSRTIKYITAVMGFGLFTVVYLFFGETKSVFWEVYGYTLKDFLLLCLITIEFLHNKNFISRLTSIGIGSYLLIPFLIRFFCACRSGADYKQYRELLNSENYSFLLTLTLFGIILMIYTTLKNDTRRN